MWRSILRTLASMAGLLFLVSVLTFYMSRLVPGDEIMDYLTLDDRGFSSTTDPYSMRRAYQKVAHNRGFDLPAFYFSIRNSLYADSVYSVLPVTDRENIKNWSRQQNDGSTSLHLYQSLFEVLERSCTTPSGNDLCSEVHQALSEKDVALVEKRIVAALSTAGSEEFQVELNNALRLAQIRKTGSFHFPSFKWNGIANQYHRWIVGLFQKKPLTSLIDGRNAWTKIGEALKWTLWLNLLSLFVAFGLGMWFGVWSARQDGTKKELGSSIFLFLLFALPGFWLATLLISFFASGDWFSWFPSGGVGTNRDRGFFISLITSIPYLILPVISLAAGSLAYISRQMKTSVRYQLTQPYVAYLRTHGLSEEVIMKKHVIRNALFPMITLFGYSVAGLFSGSLIMEVIFSIPGMGRLLYTSLIAKDWSVVFPIVLITASMTIIAFKMTDFIYAWVDPRLKSTSR